jgi:uncharacterized damage-inducible protein DinB
MMEERLIIAPEGYSPVVAAAVWGLEDTRRRTKNALTGISQAVLDRSMPESPNSIGTLLYHLVAIEMSYLYTDILEIDWSDELEPLLPYEVRDSGGVLVQVRGEPLEMHLSRMDAARNLLLAAFREITLEEFRRPRQVEDYLTTPEWVLHHLMQHEAEHRGQIGEMRVRAEAGG